MSVRVYTTNWCPDCWRAKRFLQDNGIAFEETNIEEDDQAVELVMAKNEGKRRVPTFDIDGEYYGNPTIPELANALGVAI